MTATENKRTIQYLQNGESKRVESSNSDPSVYLNLILTLGIPVPDSPDGKRQTAEDICRQKGITEASFIN